MTSYRQVEANRRNALESTGPKTEAGKQASRRNAVRHRLTAETIIPSLEDVDDYKSFELSVTAGFDARTAVEREMVLRLAGLLWRLRRAIAIETGLLQIYGGKVDVSEPMAISRSAQGIMVAIKETMRRCRDEDLDTTGGSQCGDREALSSAKSFRRWDFRAAQSL
jgi:hypothetical protein